MTEAPKMVPEMAREGTKISWDEALAYAGSLSREQLTDTSGCYCYRCVPCGNFPLGCGYSCGGNTFSYALSTIPFGCCALPYSFVGPYYQSFKRDGELVVVDAENKTLACFTGGTHCCYCTQY